MGKSRSSTSSTTDWAKHLPVAEQNLCVLCKHAAVDDKDPTVSRLGRSCKFEHNGRAYLAHRNCLYASPGLGKNNTMLPDIAFGFPPEAVVKEALRGKNLGCAICKKRGAVHGCSVKACRKGFHLYCAAKCVSSVCYFGLVAETFAC